MYYFIVNPVSGSGRGLAVWKTVEEELRRLHIEYRAFLLSDRGEARSLAAALSGSSTPCTLVAVGGDGTINEIINGLSSFRNITFACIPTGSGNDFVRGLGLEKDPVRALHKILRPKEIRKIDIGVTLCEGKPGSFAGTRSSSEETRSSGGTRPSAGSGQDPAIPCSFAVSSGTGYDAAVCKSVLTSKLKTLLNRFHSGKLVYLVTALRQLLTMKLPSIRVTVDEEAPRSFPGAYFAAAMNLPYEGGGFRFCPDARPDDGCLDLIVVSGISRLRALALLPLALFGKHAGHEGIQIIPCKKAVIESCEARCVHTDGEIPGFFQKITFSIKEEKLAVILR